MSDCLSTRLKMVLDHRGHHDPLPFLEACATLEAAFTRARGAGVAALPPA